MRPRYAPWLLGCLAAASGCALLRWSGYPAGARDGDGRWSAVELALSTAPARAPRRELPAPERLPETLYYSDLGPEEVDVSAYPAQQKHNYEAFRRQCSRCHTLARAVNSPVQSRAYWHFHALRMSLHSRFNRAGPIPPDDMKAVLDFLEYDSRVRKVENKRDFEAQDEELKRRFEPILKRVLEHMQRGPQPRLLPEGGGDR